MSGSPDSGEDVSHSGIERGRYDPATVGVASITIIPFLTGVLIGAVLMAVWTIVVAGDGT